MHLLNILMFLVVDGVAVVLYNMMTTFNEMMHAGVVIDATNIVLGLVSFLTISLGGLFIGILHGFATALVTKTTTQVRGLELALFLHITLIGSVYGRLRLVMMSYLSSDVVFLL